MKQCDSCRWWQVQTISHGSCEHPLTVIMRHAYIEHVVPFAFKELEVTYVKRNGGKDCSTFKAKP